MRKFIYILVILVSASIQAATFNSTGTGDWSDDSKWNSAPGDNDCTPAGNNTYNIGHYISSACATLDFSGTVTINVLSGGTLYLSGSGGITGSVKLNVSAGGAVIVLGNLNLSGSSDVIIDGSLSVNGDIVGVGSSFDCNGSTGSGTVTVGGTGCTNCTNAGDGGCSTNSPLPVNLLDFSATSTYSGIDLNWTTTYEKDNAWFEIERSINGGGFEMIHKRQGLVNFEGRSSYVFTDTELQDGITYYYRLVQTDVDGHQTRSTVVSGSKETSTVNLNVIPNPASNVNLSIVIQHEVHSDVLIVLQDISGRTIYSKLEHLESSSEVLSANDLHVDLIPGIYYISASNQNKLVRKKLIIY